MKNKLDGKPEFTAVLDFPLIFNPTLLVEFNDLSLFINNCICVHPLTSSLAFGFGKNQQRFEKDFTSELTSRLCNPFYPWKSTSEREREGGRQTDRQTESAVAYLILFSGDEGVFELAKDKSLFIRDRFVVFSGKI